MSIKKITGRLIVAIAFIVGATSLAGCGNDYATSTSDTHVCVFDGSKRGGQKLKFQVPPGAKSKKVDSNDVSVAIPASNRFWNVSVKDSRRDTKASKSFSAFAKGSVPVEIQGQIRFRFNLKLACEWYSRHGRRNAVDNDLKFNARGKGANDSGWFKFLDENFDQTMGQVARPSANGYDWAALVYNYPVNADDAGIVPEGTKPGPTTDTQLGQELGLAFTKQLREGLGGDYFCGISTKDNKGIDCPPITFEILEVTAPTSLTESRAKLEQTRQDLANRELEGDLLQRQQASTLKAEQAKQTQLNAQLTTAEIQARIDTAKCRAIAEVNPTLDCDGKAPQIVVGR